MIIFNNDLTREVSAEVECKERSADVENWDMKDEWWSRLCVLLFRERGTQRGDARLSQIVGVIGGMVHADLIKENITKLAFYLMGKSKLRQSSLQKKGIFI